MKFLGIIPARGGSKGIPWKNIKELNGRPLIAYTIEAALASKLDRVIVSTDSEEIAVTAREYGAEVIKRPASLSGDLAPTLPVLQHALNSVSGYFEAVVTLQPTSPLRTSQHINEAVDLFLKDPKANSLVSVVEVPHNMTPGSLMDISEGYLSNYLEQDGLTLRRQEKPTYFARNGAAIYITRTASLQEYIFGGKILAYKMKLSDSFDIDTSDDWLVVERMVRDA